MRSEKEGLQATALVNEAPLWMAGAEGLEWNGGGEWVFTADPAGALPGGRCSWARG